MADWRRALAAAGLPLDMRALCGLLPGSGRCGLIDGAVTVVASSLERFGAAYERLPIGG